jgi:hypothetical protein
MSLIAYPKLLTDPTWKKVEKAVGLSGTGVGKTLREAASTWGKFATQVDGWEKGQVPDQNANAAKKIMIADLNKSLSQLQGLVPKVKDAKKNKILTDYTNVVGSLISELRQYLDLVPGGGKDVVVRKFNTRVQSAVSQFKHNV